MREQEQAQQQADQSDDAEKPKKPDGPTPDDLTFVRSGCPTTRPRTPSPCTARRAAPLAAAPAFHSNPISDPLTALSTSCRAVHPEAQNCRSASEPIHRQWRRRFLRSRDWRPSAERQHLHPVASVSGPGHRAVCGQGREFREETGVAPGVKGHRTVKGPARVAIVVLTAMKQRAPTSFAMRLRRAKGAMPSFT